MGAVGAEWTKFWTVRATWWCLTGAGALMGMAAITLGADRATGDGVPVFAATGPVIDGAVVFSFGIAALAMLTVTAEYASGGIRATLQAVPVRGRLLAAKALVVAAVVAVLSAVGGLVTAVVVWAFLTLEPFDGAARLDAARMATDLLRLGVFGALIALLAIGVGFALRSAAGTLTVVFLLLVGLPLMMAMTGSEALVAASLRTPLFAGLAFMGSANTPAGEAMSYSAAEGLAWLVAWVTAALIIGWSELRRRDA